MDEVFPELQNMSTVPEAILEIANKGRPCAASAWHNIKSPKLEGTGQCQYAHEHRPGKPQIRYPRTVLQSMRKASCFSFFSPLT